MPDTPANKAVFGRHISQRGPGAYPQLRAVFLTGALEERLHSGLTEEAEERIWE